MIDVQRLPPARQRNVGRALEDILKQRKGYDAEVVTRAKAVVAAADALTPMGGPSMVMVDRATDSVVTAIHRLLTCWRQGLVDSVMSLDASQTQARAAAKLLEEAWFANGIGFIRDVFALQWDKLAEIQKTFSEPPIKKAIATLGLGALIEHVNKHIALYGKTLEIVTGRNNGKPNGAGETFHNTFVLFAATVRVRYTDEPAMQQALLAPYEQQLIEHREELRKERQKAKKGRAAKATPPDTSTATTKPQALDGVSQCSKPGLPGAPRVGNQGRPAVHAWEAGQVREFTREVPGASRVLRVAGQGRPEFYAWEAGQVRGSTRSWPGASGALRVGGRAGPGVHVWEAGQVRPSPQGPSPEGGRGALVAEIPPLPSRERGRG